MGPRNHTDVSEFLLLPLTEDPELQHLLLGLFLSVYLVTVLENLLIILAVSSDAHLHTPMYFLLSSLSLADIGLSTTTVPKVLVIIQAQNQHISYTGCIAQLCFVLFFIGFENCLLAVMAYDRYVAICNPLMHTVVMTPRLCVLLILLSLLFSSADTLLHSLMVLRLSFCRDREIPNFFCELDQVIKLSCSDTFINNFHIFFVIYLIGGVTIFGIIFFLMLKLSLLFCKCQNRGKYKAFSTCGSHLSVVSVFYGTVIGVYISPAVTDSSRRTAMVSVMYIIVPQMMNPFIYSLRNKDIMGAFRKLIRRIPLL